MLKSKDETLIKAAKELDELKEERVEYIISNVAYKYEIECLKKENKQLKEDIQFCLVSIKQEMEMSTDERTRKEMTTCYEILKRYAK